MRAIDTNVLIYIAALCLEHGERELITGDRDFLRFPWLKISNPFVEVRRDK